MKLLGTCWLSSKYLKSIERAARVLFLFLGLVLRRISLRKLVAVFLVIAVTARPLKLFFSQRYGYDIGGS